jgi:hypothetical protein
VLVLISLLVIIRDMKFHLSQAFIMIMKLQLERLDRCLSHMLINKCFLRTDSAEFLIIRESRKYRIVSI